MKRRPVVAVVVVVHNRLELTRECLSCLRYASQRADLKVIVVDDGSSDGTSEWLQANAPEVTILKGDGNLWFGGGTQKAIEYVKASMPEADYLMTLNNDTFMLPNCLDALVEESKGEATVAAILLDCDCTRVHCFGAFWSSWRGWIHSMTGQRLADHPELRGGVSRSVQMLNTACTLIPMKWLRTVDGINVHCYPQHHADTDLMSKLAKVGSPLRVTSLAVATNDSEPDRRQLSVRYIAFREFLKKSWRDRTSPIYLPSLIQSTWETAPNRLSVAPVLTRVLILHARQLMAGLILCIGRSLHLMRTL